MNNLKKTIKKITAIILTLIVISGIGSPETQIFYPRVVMAASYSYEYYPRCSSSIRSFADGLKQIGVNSSYSSRKAIAALNGYSNYRGTASQNSTLLSKLKNGKLVKSRKTNTSSSSEYYPACSSSVTSIVSGLKQIGVDSSYSNRKQIAIANGYSNYTGTASQNSSLLKLLKNGRLKKAGTSGSTVSIEEGTYKIATALNTNYVLDVNNYATFNGGNVEIYPYHDTNNEKWIISSVGNGYYRIKDKNSGKSLDVNGGSSESQTNVQIWEDNNGNAQKWKFVNAGNGYYYIVNANGCYLDVQNGTVSNGNNVWVYTGNGTNAQKWKLSAVSTEGASTNTSNSSNNRTNLSTALYKNSSAYISCGFDGYRNTSGRHEGIDIKLYNGAKVYSLTDGEVIRVSRGSCGSSGLSTIAIYIGSLDRTVIYLHSAPVSGLYVGKKISKGELIATESWRGISSRSGSHTHVEVRKGKRTSAAKSVGDSKLDNFNPTYFWNQLGYNVK